MKSKFLTLPVMAVAALIALPAAAAPAPPPACSASDISGASFVACAGFVSGNLIAGADRKQARAAEELQSLGLDSADGSWISKVESFGDGGVIDFGQTMYGLTYFGVHRGGAGLGGPGTAFYLIDAGVDGLESITFNLPGLSNAALYDTSAAPVPEPAAVMMWLAGLGVLGGLQRQRRRRAA